MNIAIIPARKGSKRIPNKNFTDLNGHPLWWHLLSELKGLDVTVNTDSPKFIKQLQKSDLKKIQVIERDKKYIDWENDNSIDTSPVEDMLFDFCKTIDRSEIVVLTHVTSPFLNHVEGVEIDNFDDLEFARLLKGR